MFMKLSISTLLMLLLLCQAAIGQNRLYQNRDFAELTRDHQVIAILPLQTTLDLRPGQRSRISPAMLREMQRNESNSIQKSLYSWFLTRRERGKLKVRVQNPLETNATLQKNGIELDEIASLSPSDLASLLGVDAVVMGRVNLSKPISELGAIALDAFAEVSVPTNWAVMNLFIYNGTDGDTLYNYHRRVRGWLGSTPNMLINRLMRKASRKMAYCRN